MASKDDVVAPEATAEPRAGFFLRWGQQLAVHDWLVVAATIVLLARVLRAEDSPARMQSIEYMGATLAVCAIVMLVGRADLGRRSGITTLAYRVGLMAVPLMTYFSLNTVLPVVNTHALDSELYAIDLALFGFEPAMWMDRFVTAATTEWFAFFYFGYFFLLAAHVLPILFFWRRSRLAAEFAFSLLLAFNVSHVVYTLVPGFGPWIAYASAFENPFPSGMWYDLTMDTVTRAGAMKDIFPSLHTAAPTVMALFSFRHRREFPFRYTWVPVVFFTANIIIATMFLRWHYVIDVVAGLSLALGTSLLAPRVVAWEYARRERLGLASVWPPLWDAGNAERGTASEVATA